MKYRTKSVVIEAHQWFKNGDHPLDGVGELRADPLSGEMYKGIEGTVVRFYRHPDVLDESVCRFCGNTFLDHGWIDSGEDGQTVCPGDWIVTDNDGGFYSCNTNVFWDTYEPVAE